MAYHVYHTEAIVLGSAPRGEANKRINLFTKELGLIGAVAQGVRLEKSKLRYSLEPFSLGIYAVVRGKNTWRVTDAEISRNVFYDLKENREVSILVAKILSLAERLLPGEEKNQELFNIIKEGIEFLYTSKTDLTSVEYIIVFKMLINLGYGGHAVKLEQFVKTPLSYELIAKVPEFRQELLTEINRSIRESQL